MEMPVVDGPDTRAGSDLLGHDLMRPTGTTLSVRDQKRTAEASALKLLPKIIQASSWGQKDTAEDLGREIAQIIEKTHPAIAQKILKQLATTLRPTKIVHRPEDLVDFGDARHGLDEVILPAVIEKECRC